MWIRPILHMKITWIWREFYLIFKTLLNSLNLQICSKSLKNNSKKILYFEKMPCCEKNHGGQIIHGLEYTERKILIFILKYVFLLSCKVSKYGISWQETWCHCFAESCEKVTFSCQFVCNDGRRKKTVDGWSCTLLFF